MGKWLLFTAVGCVLLSGPVLAQAPGGEEEEFDIVAALKKVAELMKQTEASLMESLSGKSPEEAAENAEKTREAIEKLLRQSKDTGEKTVDTLTEILEKAPTKPGQGGGGGSQDQQKPDSEEERRRREEEQRAKDRDPKNSKEDGKKPDSPEESQKDEKGLTAKPPPSETDDPSMPDPNDDWLGRLPDKIREAVENGQFDQIPPRFRKLLQRYFERMAEIESDR